MAYIQKDRVKETTTTTGTGPLTLAGAVVGFQAFSAVMSVADTCYYVIVSATGTDWETGTGTYSAASVLTRTTVLSSSNSGNAVSFALGTKDIFMGPIAGSVNDIAHGGTGATTAAQARTNLGVSTGTVTSVTGTGTVSGLTLTGTVTAAGNLTLGGAIATLNQNTTGNAATVTTNANLTGHITSVGNAAVLGSFTSAQLAGALSDETGTGAAVFATSPTLVTPLANALSAVPVASGAGNSLTITAGSGVGVGAGGNLVLQAGPQGTSGGDGSVLIDGLTVGRGKGSVATNTAVGLSSLNANTTGVENTAIGYNALNLNTIGDFNTAVGIKSLRYSVSGIRNTAIGGWSMHSNISGTRNTVVGFQCLGQSTTGHYNVAIGYNTLDYVISGIGNTAVGYSAGSPITSSYNTFLGYNSGYNASQLATATNSMALGNGAFTTASNQVVIGNTSITQTVLQGTVVANSGVIKTAPLTVATLPAAATSGAGARAFVTDALAPAFAAIVVTGGAISVPVYSDGTNWRVG